MASNPIPQPPRLIYDKCTYLQLAAAPNLHPVTLLCLTASPEPHSNPLPSTAKGSESDGEEQEQEQKQEEREEKEDSGNPNQSGEHSKESSEQPSSSAGDGSVGASGSGGSRFRSLGKGKPSTRSSSVITHSDALAVAGEKCRGASIHSHRFERSGSHDSTDERGSNTSAPSSLQSSMILSASTMSHNSSTSSDSTQSSVPSLAESLTFIGPVGQLEHEYIYSLPVPTSPKPSDPVKQVKDWLETLAGVKEVQFMVPKMRHKNRFDCGPPGRRA